MEEDLNDNELEERFYSALHYVDETPANITNNQNDVDHIVESTPQSSVRRYWRTSGDQKQKANTVKDSNSSINKNPIVENPKAKAEKNNPTPITGSADLSLFQSPVPNFVKKSIEIIDDDVSLNVVELESSDEDEVIEVKLPPKPTITIESSDDEEISEVSLAAPINGTDNNKVASDAKTTTNRADRDVSASPVPSIVSSVSDEFIRGDCIALNISSKRPNNHSFDFSLHGSDIVDQSTPPKKKKKKKNKDAVTSTPVIETPTAATPAAKESEYFATPKSKAKNKRQRNKNYSVSEKSIPNADVYDSDSNQSTIDLDKSQCTYVVTDGSFPSADVYESDSNQSEKVRPAKSNKGNEPDICTTSDSSVCLEAPDHVTEAPKLPKRNNTITEEPPITTVDLTDTTLDQTAIQENIVMANVTGFPTTELSDNDDTIQCDANKFGSTKVPAILYDDLDFDNLKGKEKVYKKHRYSMSTLRADMEKFYNESWGGENFNHREIQKNMSRDKSLWVIDPKDRMPGLSRRKPNCGYCNRTGHREDVCRMKPPICYMCGSPGHFEPRCPKKICVNCGSPNHVYTTMCRNCSNWHNIRCAECGQIGHPSSHCPDLWRRYHNTLTCNTPLEENRQVKRHNQMFCSGCARRGHLIHTCRLSLPFSGLPINSPYVALYNPLPFNTQPNTPRHRQVNRPNSQELTITVSTTATTPSRNERGKRQSSSPAPQESTKRRNTSNSEEEMRRHTKSPVSEKIQAKNQTEAALNKDTDQTKPANDTETPTKSVAPVEKAPDFIPITSTNRDKKGHMIQDNQVSDTSDAVTTSRIYVTGEIIDKLKTKEGEMWLKENTEKDNITVQNSDSNLFIGISGKIGDQEAFQTKLRDWIKSNESGDKLMSSNDLDQFNTTYDETVLCNNIPKNRNNVLRKISKALDSLKTDLGDPKDLYKELTYLQNHHQQLLKRKQISPKQLSNNRENMNVMLKKLNMVLLGQAGLADGRMHLRELHLIQERLTNFRQKNITNQMRNEIGQHYHCIFTAAPREDYQELLRKYYVSRVKPAMFKNKKGDNSLMINQAPSAKKKIFKSWQKRKNLRDGKGNFEDSDAFRRPLLDQTINKLVFYQRRLLSTKPHDNVLNKTRSELVNKLHSHISSLGNNMSPSSLRKMRKKVKVTQEQAQLFLANV